MALTEARKRFIERMAPGQRDAEIVDALTDINPAAGDAERTLGQPREVTFDDTPYVALASVSCFGVVLYNNTGKTVNVKRGAGSVVFPLQNGYGKQFDVSANSNELSVANASDTATVSMIWEAVGE